MNTTRTRTRFKVLAGLLCLAGLMQSPIIAAHFGTVVPIPGLLSDIALDNNRGVIYAASFTADRINVISTATRSTVKTITVAAQPSAVAMSPDGKYLVVGHYGVNAPAPDISIIDLDASAVIQVLTLGAPVRVLAVAFGNSPQALVVTTNGVRLLNPSTGAFSPLVLSDFTSTPLPVPWVTFPPSIIRGYAGVSGDGNRIYVLVDPIDSPFSTVVRYDVSTGQLLLVGITTSPIPGPRAISVDQTGDTFLAGSALLDSHMRNRAEFPSAEATMVPIGGHVFDGKRNVFYAQVVGGNTNGAVAGTSPQPATPAAPVLHVVDTDNLTVREIWKLQENIGGKAIVNGDTMYAISDSGLTVFPLNVPHRVAAVQEDLFFQTGGCNQGAVTQYLDIMDPNGGTTDFTLTVNSPGVRISPTSGTTPMRVQIQVDPPTFQDQKGTTAVPVQITSAQAVNIPFPVRLLINTRDPDQIGSINNVPGSIVDVLADPSRDMFYVLRQDKNEVLVFEGTHFTQVATLRTGNTPVQMSLYQELLPGSAALDYPALMVTNEHSQLISVFDLNTLKPSDPIWLPTNGPYGHYAHSITTSNGRIMTVTRSVPVSACGVPGSVSIGGQLFTGNLLVIDFASRVAMCAPQSVLGIYINSVDPNNALAVSPSGQMVFMPSTNGTVALYDSQLDTFLTSRKDVTSLSGAYAALSNDLFVAAGHAFNVALVPSGTIDMLGGISSNATMSDGMGLLTAMPSASKSGFILRYSTDQFGVQTPVRMAEAPLIAQNLAIPPIGQIGQMIMPFTRTLALLSNGRSMIQLSTSGLMMMPRTFEATVNPPVVRNIVNAADQTPGLAPGALISIFGSNLGNGTASDPLSSKALGNVCLYANSVALPMLYVSPTQINAQLPFNAPTNGSLVISGLGGQSIPFSFTVQPSAPAIFRNGSGVPLIYRTVDEKLITNDTPIHLNETLNIFMTGLGAVSPMVSDGTAAPSQPLATTKVTPAITIGGASIFTLSSGLVPGMVGVYQVNAQVPFHHIPTGSNIAFTITQGNASTTIKVPVQE